MVFYEKGVAYFLHSPPMYFHTAADKAAPTKGATINRHSWDNALPPSNKAGAILRTGLTEVSAYVIRPGHCACQGDSIALNKYIQNSRTDQCADYLKDHVQSGFPAFYSSGEPVSLLAMTLLL